MMYINDVKHLCERDGVFYLVRRVPVDVLPYYSSNRISISLKTKGSQRLIPLNKEALWASKQLLEANDDSIFAFPRYCDETGCKANSASGGLNKWLHQYVPDNCVIHSFRHSLRDRLRAVECPSDIVDAIGGWKTSGVGHGYGNGYPLEVLEKWMSSI